MSVGDLGTPPQPVAILIVAYNSRSVLADCLDSLSRHADARHPQIVVVVDNASADGTPQWLREQYAWVRTVAADTNLGFAGGNNLGWEHIRQWCPEAPYLVLLNPDTVVTANWLSPLIEAMRRDESIGVVQPMLTLRDDPDLVNTSGNVSHYLGFGLMRDYRRQVSQVQPLDDEIAFASGAAMMIRAAMVRQIGLFEAEMFMYLEDADLGWRVRLAGWRIAVVPASRVMHDYRFNHHLRHYEHLERNRWLLLLTHYRWRTLVLILPAVVLMELGQFAYASWHLVLPAKLRAMAWFLRPRNVAVLRARRRVAQSLRRIPDRGLTKRFRGTIQFDEISNPLLQWIANPLLGVWWGLVRHLIRW
jgi:N-acetylglucosaminyl-diphospho-decaprenol L-rhamnosyltransferase